MPFDHDIFFMPFRINTFSFIMRIRNLLPFLSFLLILASCGGKKDTPPDSALETGRVFIRASLDGDFKTAEKYILPDTVNQQLFDSYKRYYERIPEQQKENYKKASYEINKLTEQHDSTLINYSNSYMKKPMDILVVKNNSGWLVDFKYGYESADTTHP